MRRTSWLRRGMPVVAMLAAVPASAQQTTTLQGLDAYVEQALRDWEVPGAAIAVVRGDSVIFARGYGVRELGKPGRVDENTVFAIASITKSFTSALVGMLVDEDRVAFDEPAAPTAPRSCGSCATSSPSARSGRRTGTATTCTSRPGRWWPR